MIDAAARTLVFGDVAGGPDRSSGSRLVPTEPRPQITVAVPAIDVAPAGRAAITDARAAHVLGADEIGPASTLVELMGLGAKLAAGQAIRDVVAWVGRTPVLEDDTLRSRVEVRAEVVLRETASETKAGARPLPPEELRALTQALEPGPAARVARASGADEARVRAGLGKFTACFAHAFTVGTAVGSADLVTFAASAPSATDGLPGDAAWGFVPAREKSEGEEG